MSASISEHTATIIGIGLLVALAVLLVGPAVLARIALVTEALR